MDSTEQAGELDDSARSTRKSRPPRGIAVLVFVVGVACLGSEIAATRLLEPWFGASTIVWANTIATVLVALSIGYALGGRLADRGPSPAKLAGIVLTAGVLTAVVPYVANPFLRASTSAFDSLSVGTFLGSLIGVCVLVAVPLILLGIVSPYSVRLAVASVDDAGRAAGRLYAISTVGSLVGTFLASLLLIPWAGTRRTFLIFALMLALVAIPFLGRLRLPALLVPAVIIGLIAMPTPPLKTTADDFGKVVWERETEYQYARVLENEAGTRILELNEGQALHSQYTPGEWLTRGYFDHMLGATYVAGEPRSVAILGNAAGTTARALGHYSPDTHIDGVELDADLSQVGREFFDMKAPGLQVHSADARPWLRQHPAKQDAIVIDAYRQPYIPFYLTTQQFFDLAKSRLSDRGVVAVNVGHPEGSEDLEKALAATMRTVFGEDRVFRDPVTSTNTILIATTTDEPPNEGLRAAAKAAPTELAEVLDTMADDTEPALRGGPVWTDDEAPVEWLIDLSLEDFASENQ